MRPSDASEARLVAVYGYGRAGQALVRTLRELAPGADLLVLLDDEPGDEIRRAAAATGFDLVVGHEAISSALSVLPIDMIARSPGVSPYTGPLADAVGRGIPVTTATDMWFARHEPDNVIAITATKGKSTTAALTAHLLKAAGRNVMLGGNIGVSLLDLPSPPEEVDTVVVELSSYQLADFSGRIPIGVLLNLHTDHVTWHGSRARYHADKLRLVSASQVLVANRDDDEVAAAARSHSDVRWFSSSAHPVEVGEHRIAASVLRAAVNASPMIGEHNLSNTVAALTAVATVGVDPSTVMDSLASFTPLSHRLELVHDDGRMWVDDSIATIPESAITAMAAFPERPMTLIAGGHDRGQDHTLLIEAIKGRDHVRVITLPATGGRLADELAQAGVVEVTATDGLVAAVGLAARLTPRGGVVLLSPAAASFGQFSSYEERGNVFAELARQAKPPSG